MIYAVRADRFIKFGRAGVGRRDWITPVKRAAKTNKYREDLTDAPTALEQRREERKRWWRAHGDRL